jgi:Arc/MetJ-type ribon-helix-helix transcriptional regulator
MRRITDVRIFSRHESRADDVNDNRQADQTPAMTDYTTVSIPKDLADRVDETIEGTSFSSTSDLVRFLLRSIVIQHQKEGRLTESEFSEITDQLRELGYLE